jgi:TolB-like protein
VTDPGGAVFLSYASQDAAAAQQLCDGLRAAGIEVWLDQSDLRGGDAWDRKIRQQIRDCRLFLPIISQSTQARTEGYFRLEWRLADQRTHLMGRGRAFLVPVCVDATPERDADVPDSFSAVQWTRLPDGKPTPNFVARVEKLLNDQTAGAVAGQPAELGRVVVASSSTLRWPIGVAIAAVIAVAAAWYYITVGPRHELLPASRVPAAEPSAATSPAFPEKSVAVLPFVDMSEEKDQEYFGDGMAEEILDLLAKIPGLTVIGRTSSFQFKGKNADLRMIGTQLNAAHVLEGSVRKAGDQLRITAQLINTRSGTHEWSETYDRHIGDALKLQDAIAAAVVRELQLTVAPEDLQSRDPLKSAEVYDLMLRGRHAADRNDKEGYDEAVTLFKQALDRDATSANASAELAYAYYLQGANGFLTPAESFEQARQMAATALRLDPKNALAHDVLGKIHIVYDWDWAAAEREFQEVGALAPGSAEALYGQARVSLTLGRWDDALRQVKGALALDPLAPGSFEALADIQMRRGRLGDAEAAMRRGLDIRPTYAYGHFYLGLVLLARGDRDAALAEMQKETSDEAQQGGLAIVYHALGRKADSDAALARMLKEQADGNAFGIAEVYAFRGQADEAMHWLERAYAQRDPGLTYIEADLPLKNLENNLQYKAFLRKMKLPE